MRRVGGIGLRAKLVLALVATSAVTLFGAFTALSPPIEHRIEHDRVTALRQLARTSRLALAQLPAADLRPGSASVARITRQLQRRTGGRVALFTGQGRSLDDTDPNRRDPGSGALERVQDAGLARAGDVREGVRGEEAIVVAGVRNHGRRLTLVLRKPLDDSRAAAAVVRRAVPLAAAVGLAIALLMGVLLSAWLLRRLERLRGAALRMAEEGIDEPLRADGARDEVGDLARALETMRSRLVGQEHARQTFLATASHELRTPLASLLGTLELLDEALGAAVPDVAASRRRAAVAARQTRTLSRLATDLLDLSRLDGDVRLHRDPMDLGGLAFSVMSEFEDRARELGVELVLAPAEPRVWAVADAPSVARIVRILLDNALGYGASGGRVEVSMAGATAGPATAAVPTVGLRVADLGPGVDPLEAERIFARFERGTAGEGESGFGLGLAIGRELARRMGGDLIVMAGDGPGACFELRLPAGRAPLPDEAGIADAVTPGAPVLTRPV